ncbi:hypothetical protein Taro_003026 [Colocasia esculenta]|uniref:Uncharacterized protein n=1 Tax=Colocasia esculenta TaxID=4460 RepID=A0A843TN18_COLES|nr:hypothetical protein [Colocasia esculenta]
MDLRIRRLDRSHSQAHRDASVCRVLNATVPYVAFWPSILAALSRPIQDPVAFYHDPVATLTWSPLQRLAFTPVYFLLKRWITTSGDEQELERSLFAAKKLFWEFYVSRQLHVFEFQSMCVDTQADCVDTIGFICSDCFLGQSSSVDTQVDCVDTTG